MRVLAAIGYLAATPALAACDSRPVVRWRVQFACDKARQEANAVETRILAGGCEGSEVYSAWVDREGDTGGLEPPGVLRPGDYGFEATAIDGRGEPVAVLCRELRLPSEEPVELTLAQDFCGAGAAPADFGEEGMAMVGECEWGADCGICRDNPDFVDAHDNTCEDWQGYDCAEAETRWGFSAEAAAALREQCPRVCGVCA